METSVGERLATLRRAKAKAIGRRYTQTDLAQAVGVSKGTVANWETDVQVPSGENLVRLARALDTTPAAILGSEETAEDAVYRPGEGEEGSSEDADHLALVLEQMDNVARYMTRIGAPGEGTLRKRAYLAGIREIITAAGLPVPAYWYELSEKVESGAL